MASPDIKKLMQQLACDPHGIGFAVVAEELRKRRRYYQALEIALRGTSRNPYYAAGWFTLGMIYLDLEQSAQAKTSFLKTIALDPDHTKAMERLLDISVSEQKWDKAAIYADKILNRWPMNTRVKQISLTVSEKIEEEFQKKKAMQVINSIEKNNRFTKLTFRHKIIQNIRKLLSSVAIT